MLTIVKKLVLLPAWLLVLAGLWFLWICREAWTWLRRVVPAADRDTLPIPWREVALNELDTVLGSGQPVVLSGFAKQWSFFDRCTPEYLKQVMGERQVDVLSAASDSRSFSQDWSDPVRMPYSELIDVVFNRPPGERCYYHWNADVTEFKADMPAEVDGRQYDRGATGVWVGQSGNITKLHYEWWHGFLAQIKGRKRVVLFPPGESASVYRESLFVFPMPRRISKLPTDCLKADRERFPRTFQARRYEAVLEAGDAVYIPPFWWHEVECVDNCISMPVRFLPTLPERLHPSLFPLAWHEFRVRMSHNWRRLRKRLGVPQESARNAARLRPSRESLANQPEDAR